MLADVEVMPRKRKIKSNRSNGSKRSGLNGKTRRLLDQSKVGRRCPLAKGLRRELFSDVGNMSPEDPPYHEARILELQRLVELGLPTDGREPSSANRVPEPPDEWDGLPGDVERRDADEEAAW